MEEPKNPYSKQPGFGLRLYHARNALQKYGRDYSARPYSRGFDNCFEGGDGSAVVWGLMHEAIVKNNENLAEGIRRTGKDVWPSWLEVYERRGKYAPEPEPEQLPLFGRTHRRGGPDMTP